MKWALGILKAAWAMLSGSRETLILLGLASAAAGLYAWGASGRAERDRLEAWAQQLCLAAGSEFTGTKPKAKAQLDGCTALVASLAAYKRESQSITAATLARAAERTEAKATADRTLATAQATRRTANVQAMEKADETIAPNDRVGGDWFDRLNDLAGLRPAPD
ncbi:MULTISPECIES: hypothetical protein [unclassified Sphingobium]|uniref:hypothetical protein n=1 Tax=unclassified Sphingobium TaxID=2611147 RepID=UPI0022246C9D|nr:MULTISPECIES: hypothetical protein [unclassified Sphingobium]MCW2410880.1 hypothetical protein [Sphingobium sp. B8D3D]MCW2416830.1 hypothetical protein [Sphingobium sp. B8D3A]